MAVAAASSRLSVGLGVAFVTGNVCGWAEAALMSAASANLSTLPGGGAVAGETLMSFAAVHPCIPSEMEWRSRQRSWALPRPILAHSWGGAVAEATLLNAASAHPCISPGVELIRITYYVLLTNYVLPPPIHIGSLCFVFSWCLPLGLSLSIVAKAAW